ncbi:MAG: xylulokinase [Spirochaetia bacterium]|jgi:xylulokinase|nr:xylulokinase [Spirochaetia bacterium]
MAITVGIDCGTQSTKVLCYDSEEKKVVATASSSHQLISREDGSREQEASWFSDAIVDCFSQLPSEVRKQIRGIGVSGQQHGFVALDAAGKPLVPVKLWCDTSTAGQCVELTEKLGGKERVFALLGNQILPGYTASKILALKEHDKKTYAKLRHILLPHDFINYFLTGEFVMEQGDASGTALFDVRNRKWSKPVLAAIDAERDLSECLPRVIACTEEAGRVTEKTAALLGIPAGILVSCGGGDNMMGAIGCGCTEEGSLVMSMGTSGTLFGYSDTCITDEKGRLAAFISSSGGYLPLLCTMNCTVVSEQVRKLFGSDVVSFDKLASEAPAGCNGVVFLPYFNGERTPNYPHGEGVLAGLKMGNTSRENIARAALESAVYSMKVGLEAFVEKGFQPKSLLLIGGGSNSKVWAQMVSDIFGLPVSIPAVKETAAFGGALQVLALIDGHTIAETTRAHVKLLSGRHYEPDRALEAAYSRAYAKYRSYDGALSGIFSHV